MGGEPAIWPRTDTPQPPKKLLRRDQHNLNNLKNSLDHIFPLKWSPLLKISVTVVYLEQIVSNLTSSTEIAFDMWAMKSGAKLKVSWTYVDINWATYKVKPSWNEAAVENSCWSHNDESGAGGGASDPPPWPLFMIPYCALNAHKLLYFCPYKVQHTIVP